MNKTDIEKDFYQRYGNGNVHTCFVPLLVPIMGAECWRYGGTTLLCALDAGVWLCAGIRPDHQLVIGTTADNVRITIPRYRREINSLTPAYRFADMLLRHFEADSGLNLLFHCDIPHTPAINDELSYFIVSALTISSIFSDRTDDIGTLISDFTGRDYHMTVNALMSIRRNHAVCINGKELTLENVPICPDNFKLICTYPSAGRQKARHILKNGTPLPLNDLKLDAIDDKSGELYAMTLSSHNTLAAFKTLKNSGSDAFFATFSEHCGIDGCVGCFKSDTDIYFTADNHIDHVMCEIDRTAKQTLSFIVSGCSGGAIIY